MEKLRLIFALLIISAGVQAQSDTTKFYESKDFGWKWQRMYPSKQLLLPKDTTFSKFGIAEKNGTVWHGNGSYWTAISGGGSGTTPTLDQVASQGNTTGRGLYVNAEDNGFFVTDPSGNPVASLRGNGAEGRVRMNRLSGGSVELAASRATGSRTIQFPDSSGTVVLTQLLADTAAAIRSSIENYGTFINDRLINGAGHNLTIDSVGTMNLSSKDPAMVDIANLTLSSTGQYVSLGYSTDTTSAALGIDPYGGVQQSIVNTGTTPFTSSTILRIDSSLYQINTDYLRVNIPSAQPGYVLTSSDTYGTATWQPDSSISRAELQDTAAAIRADIGTSPDLQGAINNGSTLTGAVTIETTEPFTVQAKIFGGVSGLMNVDVGNASLRASSGTQTGYVIASFDSTAIKADTFRIRTGTPAAGYVLTASDSHGTATWQPASGGSNVGDSLVRAFDSLSAHNTRIGANTVAIAARAALSGAAFTGAVGIGTTASASAALEISSTTKGVLLPRMTTAQRDAISSPATGLMIWNTDLLSLDIYSGSSWYSVNETYNDDIQMVRDIGSPIKIGPSFSILSLSTGTAMISGRSYFGKLEVKFPTTISGTCAWYQTTAGNYVGDNTKYNGIALFQETSAGTVTLIDSTARDTEIWKGTSGTWQTKSLVGGSRTLQPGVYYYFMLYNNSSQTTAPVVGNTASGTGNYLAPLTSSSRRIYGGVITSVSAVPTSQAMSAWNSITTYYGMYFY